MPVSSAASFLESLREHQLLDPAQLEELATRKSAEPRSLARDLIERGWLTPYQVNQVFQDRTADLVFGPYVLLDRLGEPDSGKVFKARHRKMRRIVAIKRLRKDQFADAATLQRFRAEVDTAASLSHPNLLHAYDADQVGDSHVLVMEFVEGKDLAQLVKERGPLPIAEACDYVRQAALGLQHAFERGLTYDDLKPDTLLVQRSRAGTAVVKVLRTSVGRRGTPADLGAANPGTADFIAPEQARSAVVDVRASLYRLGATLYYLLTAQVPFLGGSPLDKLIRHQKENPVPVEQLRPDVPAAVAGVVRRLLAKHPEDRFETPGEVAQALAEEASTAATRPSRKRRRLWIAIAMALLVAGILAGVFFATRSTRTVSTAAASSPVVADDPAWIASVARLTPEKQLEAVLARLRERNPSFDGKATPQVGKQGVEGLTFPEQAPIADLSPLRGLPALRVLYCRTRHLTDLSGLRGAPLSTLDIAGSKVRDLAPLRGMPLASFNCSGTPVSDLGPLADLPLTNLSCSQTAVTDLTPLTGMKLTSLSLLGSAIRDLGPLQGMPLKNLECRGCKVSDYSALRDSPLEVLNCDFQPARDAATLRSIKSLKVVNGQKAEDVLK
ncbi:MAG: protein kinase [Gemmataceae bacterium]|nr:protein kinase [Gemmataceae bacterium]